MCSELEELQRSIIISLEKKDIRKSTSVAQEYEEQMLTWDKSG